MHGRGGDQIGLEADGVEDVVAREAPLHLFLVGGRAVDRRERAADFRGEARIGLTFAQQVFPYRVAGRVEVLHGEHAAFLRDHLRHGARHGGRGDAEPFVFIAAALDRRFPDLRHAQARKRALHAHRPACQVDPPDIGRDAAAERLDMRHLGGPGDAGAAQQPQDGFVQGLKRCRLERSHTPSSPKPRPKAAIIGA